MRRMPFVLQGDFTEFLKKEFGYKKWEPSLFYSMKDSVMPLEIVPLAYSKVEFKAESSSGLAHQSHKLGSP